MSLVCKKPEPVILSSVSKIKLRLRAEDLQRSDGCELTLSNVTLWISAKQDMNHSQMVEPTRDR